MLFLCYPLPGDKMTANENDALSYQEIKKHLNKNCRNLYIEVSPCVSSTNTLARKKAEQGINEGYTLIANAQSQGRGRRGRVFYSPADTGIYMSIVLRPSSFYANEAIKLTTLAAVAVCEAIEKVTGKKTQIKWVNDIFIENKKICGILTEASFNSKDKLLEYAIIGIGVNVYSPKDGFPTEIKGIAGAIWDTPQNEGKNRIAAEILNSFMKYYYSMPNVNCINEYRSRSLVTGKEIQILTHDKSISAKAIGIDDDFHLIVRYGNGSTQALSSGEISIRYE